jgi:hypothetical protein
VTSISKRLSAVTNVGRNYNGPKVMVIWLYCACLYACLYCACRPNNDLHEGWNDSIAVLRRCAGEILASVKIL